MADRDPISILNASRQAALSYAAKTSATGLTDLLQRAQSNLNARLKDIPASDKSFTVTQMRAALKQIQAVTDMAKTGLLQQVVTGANVVAGSAAAASIKYLTAAEKRHKGVGGAGLGLNTAAVLDKAVSGTNASVLQRVLTNPNHPGHKGVMQRYGESVVGHFETTLQTALITGQPWDSVKEDLTKNSPFLQQAPAHWAERIVRTEFMAAHNTAGNNAISEINDQTGGNLIRILCATFDNRTGADSYAVHGQIRGMSEPFESWFGLYMTPPNRPNDREIVIPHHMEWKIPENLHPKTDGQITARWHEEGRKGSPPHRPLMTTVDLSKIGTPLPPPLPLVPDAKAILGEKLAGPGGSNEGGVYQGKDGVQRYVKFYQDDSQAAGEVLANHLYSDMGQHSLKSQAFEYEGKQAYASEMIEGATQLSQHGLTPELANQVLDGFVGDLITANWDAVGMNLDNVVVRPDGTVMRIDNGGTFLMRAKAGRKKESDLNSLSEWDKLFDPKINPAYAKVAHAAGVNQASDMLPRIKDQFTKLLDVMNENGGWAGYVAKYASNLSKQDSAAVVKMMESRTKLLEEKIAAADAMLVQQALAKAKPKVSDPPKVKAAKKKVKEAVAAVQAAPVTPALGPVPTTSATQLAKLSVPELQGLFATAKQSMATIVATHNATPLPKPPELIALMQEAGKWYQRVRVALKKAKVAAEKSDVQLPVVLSKHVSDVILNHYSAQGLGEILDLAMTDVHAAVTAVAKVKGTPPPVLMNALAIARAWFAKVQAANANANANANATSSVPSPLVDPGFKKSKNSDFLKKDIDTSHQSMKTNHDTKYDEKLKAAVRDLDKVNANHAFDKLPTESLSGLKTKTIKDSNARSHTQLATTCSNPELNSVKEFTRSSYTDMRAAVYCTKDEYNAKSRRLSYEEARDHVNKLNAVLEKRKHKTAQDLETQVPEMYRGIKNLDAKTFNTMINQTGIKWHEPTSTSRNPLKAQAFYTGSSDQFSILFRIKPTKNTSGVSIEGHSQYNHEAEILFGNGVKFRVTKVVRDADKPRGAIMYLEEI